MSGQSPTATPANGDVEYGEYLEHTAGCIVCAVLGEPCDDAIQLGRAWREARG